MTVTEKRESTYNGWSYLCKTKEKKQQQRQEELTSYDGHLEILDYCTRFLDYCSGILDLVCTLYACVCVCVMEGIFMDDGFWSCWRFNGGELSTRTCVEREWIL